MTPWTQSTVSKLIAGTRNMSLPALAFQLATLSRCGVVGAHRTEVGPEGWAAARSRGHPLRHTLGFFPRLEARRLRWFAPYCTLLTSAAISRQSTLVAWCGYQGHGLPLALKGEPVSSREASVACGLRGRYSAFRPAVVHACAWPLPNPSINRTCPGKPGHAGYLKR